MFSFCVAQSFYSQSFMFQSFFFLYPGNLYHFFVVFYIAGERVHLCVRIRFQGVNVVCLSPAFLFYYLLQKYSYALQNKV